MIDDVWRCSNSSRQAARRYSTRVATHRHASPAPSQRLLLNGLKCLRTAHNSVVIKYISWPFNARENANNMWKVELLFVWKELSCCARLMLICLPSETNLADYLLAINLAMSTGETMRTTSVTALWSTRRCNITMIKLNAKAITLSSPKYDCRRTWQSKSGRICCAFV